MTDEVSLDPLRWGLIPYWCEDPKGGRKPINIILNKRWKHAKNFDAWLALVPQMKSRNLIG